jgi:hypothetical protein
VSTEHAKREGIASSEFRGYELWIVKLLIRYGFSSEGLLEISSFTCLSTEENKR